MNFTEIHQYVTMSARKVICVFREKLEKTDLFVMSIYVSRRGEQYEISVEFDLISMVDDGEGCQWRSAAMELEVLVKLLENFIGKKISDWENVSKTGKYDFVDALPDREIVKEQAAAFKSTRCGENLLPMGFTWKLTPFESND